MPTMRAIDIKGGKGPVDALFINDKVPKPEISGTQALVKVKAFGLNRMDALQREGQYPVPKWAPSTLGVEFSGTIEDISEDESSCFKKGDPVFGLAYGGAYAEYIAVSTKMLIPKPDELSWEQAAGIPEVWITALQALMLVGEFTKGKSVLWHAGASSVSIAGQQLSQAEGASKVFATARSDEKCDFCVDKFGITAAYNTSTTHDWDQKILEATDGKGVDIIIDFIGPDTFAKNINAIAKDGRIVTLACMSGSTLESTGANLASLVVKRVRYEGSTLRSRDENYQRRLRDRMVEKVLPKFIDKSFTLYVEKVFPWEEIQAAQKQMEANLTKGKLICTIS